MAGRLTSLGRADDDHYPLIRVLGVDGSGNVLNILTDSAGRLLSAFEGDLTVTMGDVEKGVTGTYWGDERREYTGINLIYEGKHTTNKAGTDDTGWRVWKYTWDANGLNTRKQGPVTGKWDDRTTGSWWA